MSAARVRELERELQVARIELANYRLRVAEMEAWIRHLEEEVSIEDHLRPHWNAALRTHAATVKAAGLKGSTDVVAASVAKEPEHDLTRACKLIRRLRREAHIQIYKEFDGFLNRSLSNGESWRLEGRCWRCGNHHKVDRWHCERCHDETKD